MGMKTISVCEGHDHCIIFYDFANRPLSICPLCEKEDKVSWLEDKIGKMAEEISALKSPLSAMVKATLISGSKEEIEKLKSILEEWERKIL